MQRHDQSAIAAHPPAYRSWRCRHYALDRCWNIRSTDGSLLRLLTTSSSNGTISRTPAPVEQLRGRPDSVQLQSQTGTHPARCYRAASPCTVRSVHLHCTMRWNGGNRVTKTGCNFLRSDFGRCSSTPPIAMRKIQRIPLRHFHSLRWCIPLDRAGAFSVCTIAARCGAGAAHSGIVQFELGVS